MSVFLSHSGIVNKYSLLSTYPDYTLPLAGGMREVARDSELERVPRPLRGATRDCGLSRGQVVKARPGVVHQIRSSPACMARIRHCWDRIRSYRPAIEHALSHSDVDRHPGLRKVFRLRQVTYFSTRTTGRGYPEFFCRPRNCDRETRFDANLAWSLTSSHVVHISNVRPRLFSCKASPPHKAQGRSACLSWPAVGFPLTSRFSIKLIDLSLRAFTVKEQVRDVEEYLNAADTGLYTSESESFGLSILETLFQC